MFVFAVCVHALIYWSDKCPQQSRLDHADTGNQELHPGQVDGKDPTPQPSPRSLLDGLGKWDQEYTGINVGVLAMANTCPARYKFMGFHFFTAFCFGHNYLVPEYYHPHKKPMDFSSDPHSLANDSRFAL